MHLCNPTFKKGYYDIHLSHMLFAPETYLHTLLLISRMYVQGYWNVRQNILRLGRTSCLLIVVCKWQAHMSSMYIENFLLLIILYILNLKRRFMVRVAQAISFTSDRVIHKTKTRNIC